jgi:hypothetical protein
MPLRATHVGEVGFLEFVHALERLGVLDRNERLAWIQFHGAALRASGTPLDTGHGVPDGLVDRLLEEAAE